MLLTPSLRPARAQDLQGAFHLGGAGEDFASAAARDQEGNLWLAGSFSGIIDVDPGRGTHWLTSTGYSNVFIVRLSPGGTLAWAGQLSGLEVEVRDLAVAADGSVAMVGSFSGSTDFDPGTGQLVLTPPSVLLDAYVLRLASSGELLWAGQIGGAATDVGTALAVTPDGGLVVGGSFEGTADLNPGPRQLLRTAQGVYEAFVLRLSAVHRLAWADVIVGGGSAVRDVAVGPAGEIAAVGGFGGQVDLDPGPGAFLVLGRGIGDGFLLLLGRGGLFKAAGTIGGPHDDLLVGVGFHPDGDLAVGGTFSDIADLDPRPQAEHPVASRGFSDVFVARLDGELGLRWAQAAGGRYWDTAAQVAVDSEGGTYLAGGFDSYLTFASGETTFQFAGRGGRDGFLWKATPSGAFDWAVRLGGGSPSDGLATVAVDPSGVLAGGYFSETADLDPGVGTLDVPAAGGMDAFWVALEDVDLPPAAWIVPDDFSTIQSAIDAARHFDSVGVRPGVYYENLDFHGQHVALRALEGAQTTVIDGGGAGPVVSFRNGEGRGALIGEFTLRNGAAHNGGGVQMTAWSSPSVQGNVIRSNLACGGGGGISVDLGAPSIADNEIVENHQQPGCQGGQGGGVRLQTALGAELRRNVIVGNTWDTAWMGGGGIAFWGPGAPLVENNAILFNSTSGSGGGLYMINHPEPLLVQNLIVGNSAGIRGGGAYWLGGGDSGPILLSNTIADNTAPTGAAVYGDLTQQNVVFVNNIVSSAVQADLIACEGVPPIFDHNDFFNSPGPLFSGTCQGVVGSSGNLGAEPRFVNAANGDYRLLSTSPAIDAGWTAAPLTPSTDFEGDPRVVDGDGDSIPEVDMGAYEQQGAAIPASVLVRSPDDPR